MVGSAVGVVGSGLASSALVMAGVVALGVVQFRTRGSSQLDERA